MPAHYDVITFDCYGTLIDWDHGIRRGLANAAAHDGATVDVDRLLEAYHAAEPAVQAEAFRPYREVLAESATRAAHRVGWAMRTTTAHAFAAGLPEWPPFADTNAALARLVRAGYRLGILSNVDDDLILGTLRHIHVPFELVVTAQQVGSYKPAHGHFREARRRLEHARWLHAAQSHFHDVTPCAALGIPCVWINRKREQIPPDGAAPITQTHDLAGLADWLGA